MCHMDETNTITGDGQSLCKVYDIHAIFIGANSQRYQVYLKHILLHSDFPTIPSGDNT